MQTTLPVQNRAVEAKCLGLPVPGSAAATAVCVWALGFCHEGEEGANGEGERREGGIL